MSIGLCAEIDIISTPARNTAQEWTSSSQTAPITQTSTAHANAHRHKHQYPQMHPRTHGRHDVTTADDNDKGPTPPSPRIDVLFLLCATRVLHAAILIAFPEALSTQQVEHSGSSTCAILSQFVGFSVPLFCAQSFGALVAQVRRRLNSNRSVYVSSNVSVQRVLPRGCSWTHVVAGSFSG